jgi:tetratricopeptide (TPR) repeat protein
MSAYIRSFTITLCLLLMPAFINAQTPAGKTAPQKATKDEKAGTKTARERPDPLASQRQATAIALATNLAEEARSYHDEQLRARVQVRAADALWETNAEQARALFRRAWEAADTADREANRLFEEKRRAAAENGGGWVGSGPPNLRGEVLRLAARRDRALGEEFLAKLSEANDKENQNLTANADNANAPAQPTLDPESAPPMVAQRLRLARSFLEEGDVERALQFADKALDVVTTRGINFLSALREKDQAAADKRFAAMFQRAAADPSSDAAAVSVMSSYAFTPFLTLVVRSDGRNHTSQESERITAPNMSPELRAAFMRAAAQILLRPVPTPDQDRTVAGRGGLYFTIARMLPLFDQYASDLSPELRAQMGSLATDAPERFRNGTDKMLTRGLVPEESQRDEGQEALENADRAATPADRDLSFARAAMVAARKGDITARDLVDKIQDTEMRKSARTYVDFTLVGRALERKDAQEALRLARTGELPSIHRVWALTEVSQLVKKTDAKSAGEILDEAANEARRIGGTDPDRTRGLFGVATRMYEIDRGRAWEVVSEAVKSANSATGFTGSDAEIVSRFQTTRGTSTSNFNVESFDLNGIFGLMAKDDLFRAVELAKSFTGEAPRATATLAIIRAVLDKKQNRRESRSESQVVTND